MISWRPFFFTSSICIIIVSISLLMIHFGQMIPWFIYGLYNFAIYDLLLIFADIFFITLGTTSLIISLNDNDENITYKYKRLLLILIVAFTFTIAYPFIFLLQWTSHFAISQRFIIYFGPALSFISPSISVCQFFWLYLKGVKSGSGQSLGGNAINGEEAVVVNGKQLNAGLLKVGNQVEIGAIDDVFVDLPLQKQPTKPQVEKGVVYEQQQPSCSEV
ncbi:hypothetical protein ABK040_007295 [Willaertia magna]